jgi:hypothetical protein
MRRNGLLALAAVTLFLFLAIAITGSTQVIVTDREEARPGEKLKIEGTGFPGSTQFRIYIDEVNVANGTTYGGGSFYRTITLSRLIGLGNHNVTVWSGDDVAHTSFIVVQWQGSVSVTPMGRRPGEDFAICGQGYPPIAFYRVYLDGEGVLFGVTDEEGEFCTTYTLPISTPVGDAEISATATQYTGPPTSSQMVEVTQWSPSIVTDPAAPTPGGAVTLSGSGLPPASFYKVYLDGDEVMAGTCSTSGTFSRSYVLAPGLSIGNHQLRLTAPDYYGPPAGELQFEVVQWGAILTRGPGAVHPGANLTIQGREFPSNTRYQVRLDGSSIVSGNTTTSGTFALTYELPKDFALGAHEILALAPDYADPPTGVLELEVTQWPVQIMLLPDEIHRGVTINVTGRGFPPGAPYEIYLDTGLKILGGIANSSGGFSRTYRLSNLISIGDYHLNCIVGGYSGPPQVLVEFEIVPWQMTTTYLPEDPHPGSLLVVIGTEYPPGSAYYIGFDGVQVSQGIVPGTSSWNTSYALPPSTTLGVHNLTVSSSFPRLSTVVVPVDVVQWRSSILLDSYSGTQGDLIALSGTGWPPDEPARIYWDDLHIKTTEISENGSLQTVIAVPGDGEDMYHRIRAEIPGGYTGPPGSYVYFWVGLVPPLADFAACDGGGSQSQSFFLGDAIHVKGSGLPPSTTMRACLIREGDPYLRESSVLEVWISSDAAGVIAPSPLGAPVGALSYRCWLDINSNGILDGNDMTTGALSVVSRPDVAIVETSISSTNPVRGEVVKIGLLLQNLGDRPVAGSLVVTFGTMQVASALYDGIQPDSILPLEVAWDTSSATLSREVLAIRILPLPGETNLSNNEASAGEVSVIARPNITMVSVSPDARTVHKGDELGVRIGVRNNGPSSQSFRVSLIWGGSEVAKHDMTLEPGRTGVRWISWDTAGSIVGSMPISASAETLPHEWDPADNHLVNGSVRVTPPNKAPSADAGGPYSALVNEKIGFDASLSFDADGRIVLFRWDFGDGTWGFGERIEHHYSQPASYQVTLTVTDDDGDSASIETLVEVTILETKATTFVVYDDIKLTPVVGAVISVDGANYTTGEFPVTVELRVGAHTVQVSKPGFSTQSETFYLDSEINKAYKLSPILELHASDSAGAPVDDFGPLDSVYITLTAPDEYPALLFVVNDRGYSDGRQLQDVRPGGSGHIVSENGTTISLIWGPGLFTGKYDLVLDLNSNGIYNNEVDIVEGELGYAFAVFEPVLWAGLVCLSAAAALRRGR